MAANFVAGLAMLARVLAWRFVGVFLAVSGGQNWRRALFWRFKVKLLKSSGIYIEEGFL